jgi:uncharacterized coiled-coil protein SlyX
VTKTPEAQSQAEQPVSTTLIRRSRQKSIVALSVFALGLNAAAAVYTFSPSDFVLPNVGALAELLPGQRGPDPMRDQMVATLKDIQSTQQQHVASLQANSFSLQQSTDLLKQETITLALLRRGVTDEQTDLENISAQIADAHGDVKKISDQVADEHGDVRKISDQVSDEHGDVRKISDQVSKLMAKVDSLQNSLAPQVTSSIPAGHSRNRPFGMRKKMARQHRPVGPVLVPGGPLNVPVTTPARQG